VVINGAAKPFVFKALLWALGKSSLPRWLTKLLKRRLQTIDCSR
jgi:hypothetical protein